MGTIYRVNFRDTLAPTGFPGDGPNGIWAGTSVYSSTVVLGGLYSIGWVAAYVGFPADDPSYQATYPHLAGYMAATTGGGSATYHIDGFIPGRQYKLHVAQGAISTGVTTAFGMWEDNRSTSVISTTPIAQPGGGFADFNTTYFSNAGAWTSGETPYIYTPKTGKTGLWFGKDGTNMYLNSIGIEDITTAAAPASTAMMMGV